MAELGTLAVVWRVAVAVFVIVMPTVMFFQLLRFLEWLRDDDLIVRLGEHHDLDVDERDDHLATMAAESGSVRPHTASSSESTGDILRRCDSCGTRNVAEATYCSGCLDELE